MTKEVMVSIKGLQFDQSADSEEIETIQWGQYYKKMVLIMSFTMNLWRAVRNRPKISSNSGSVN